VTEIGN